jgi:hypothetical protein
MNVFAQRRVASFYDENRAKTENVVSLEFS